MKIAVTGKGGVGKTSFAATLARIFAEEGRNVLAADADKDNTFYVLNPKVSDIPDKYGKLYNGVRSIQTYRNVKRLALGLGVRQVRGGGSKVRDEQDEIFIRERIPEEDFLGFIHYNPDILLADRMGMSPYDCSRELVQEVKEIIKRMEM